MTTRAWIAGCLIAVIAGLGIAAARIAYFGHSPSFHTYGSWRGSINLPLNKDALVTTQMTLFSLFALPSDEAVYLFAGRGEPGRGFSGDNAYTIEGNIHSIKAEYWSITAYGKDLYLIPNAENRFSFNPDNLQTDSSGNFKITISATQQTGNWLPVAKDKKFELVLRIYHGDNDFIEHLDKASLPEIKRL